MNVFRFFLAKLLHLLRRLVRLAHLCRVLLYCERFAPERALRCTTICIQHPHPLGADEGVPRNP